MGLTIFKAVLVSVERSIAEVDEDWQRETGTNLFDKNHFSGQLSDV
jgi:hypothetical protein